MNDISLREKYLQDISALNSFDSSASLDLVGVVLDFLLKSFNSQDFEGKLAEVMTKARLNSAAVKSVVKLLIIIFRQALNESISSAQLKDHLQSLSLSEALSSAIATLWEKKSSNVAAYLVSRSVNSNKLVDLDWSFGVTASSDDFDQVGKTYLQVKLKIDSDEGVKDVFFELSLDQFYSFLAELEKCKSFLDALTAT